VVPFPTPLEPVRRVRSTLLLASQQALRTCGYFDAYRERLDPELADGVLGVVAGTWVPTSTALAHYRACDNLGLTSPQQMELGRHTGHGLKQHLTRIVAALSRSVGISPWLVFEQYNRFWARAFEGGGVCVIQHGLKEAEVMYQRCVLFESRYFRSAARGVAAGLLASVTRRAFVSELALRPNPHEARFRFSWV
jgi:hypothetical protein